MNALVFAYNCTRLQTTGFAPYELLFGRAPRLPIDHEFNLTDLHDGQPSYVDFVSNLKDKMQYSHDLANKHMTQKAEKFPSASGPAVLEPGDRVLLRKVGLIGRNKLADRWEESVYVVVEQKDSSIPVYVVQPEGGGKKRVLHRNMIRPIGDVVPPTLVNSPPQVTTRKSRNHKLLDVMSKVVRSDELVEDVDPSSEDEDDYYVLPSVSYPSVEIPNLVDTLVIPTPIDVPNDTVVEDPGPASPIPETVLSPVASPQPVVPVPSPRFPVRRRVGRFVNTPVRRSTRQRRQVDRYSPDIFSMKSQLLSHIVDKVLG